MIWSRVTQKSWTDSDTIPLINTFFRFLLIQCRTLSTCLFMPTIGHVKRDMIVGDPKILDGLLYYLKILVGSNSLLQRWLVRWRMSPTYKHIFQHIPHLFINLREKNTIKTSCLQPAVLEHLRWRIGKSYKTFFYFILIRNSAKKCSRLEGQKDWNFQIGKSTITKDNEQIKLLYATKGL